MNIYLLRHPAVYNPHQLCYGQSEIPLMEHFTMDFDWLKDQLNLKEQLICYSSPYKRCTKLAAYLSDQVVMDERLSELNFGDWEMKSWAEIPEQELNPWMQDFVHHRMENGENFNDLFDRTIQFYEELVAQDQEDVVVVTHAGVIRSMVSYVLDIPLAKAFHLKVDYSSITKIEFDATHQLSVLAYSNRNPKIAPGFPASPDD